MTWKPSKIEASSIVGRAVAAAEEKFDGNLVELRVAVGHRKPDGNGEYVDNGTTWLTYKANGEHAAALKDVGQGDLIEITNAVIESREFESKGEKRSSLEARFGTITVLERKGEGRQSSAPVDNRTATAVAADSNDGW